MTSRDKFVLESPVLYLVFNRIDTVKKTFPEIKKAKPKKLFVAADGPRNGSEKEKTDEVRTYILENVDWDCEVKTLFREKNQGCRLAVSSAIDWFFEDVESGIIIEDDCLPSQSFFRFCQELLEKYKDDKRIMQIGGTNVEIKSRLKESYFFSGTFNAWGWATWRRAWKHYDVRMKKWKKYRLGKIFFSMPKVPFYIRLKSWRLFNKTYHGEIDTWDYQWIFSCIINSAFSIVPKVNLITNLGFEKNATHTSNYKRDKKTILNFELDFPLVHNDKIVQRKGYMKKTIKFFSK